MTEPAWEPLTLEDRLLERYLADNPGELFLEVNVGTGDASHGPRRLDGVLIPGVEPKVHPQDSYSREQALEAIHGSTVHLLEAKRTLNRNVIGQVEVGTALLQRDYGPAEITQVAVCADGNEDLQWYCDEKGIRTAIYSDLAPKPAPPPSPETGERRDIRRPPDAARRDAFLRGWSAAVEGQLYRSILKKKTHTNMGNLFGWIYGDQPEQFRLETWDRYVSSEDQW